MVNKTKFSIVVAVVVLMLSFNPILAILAALILAPILGGLCEWLWMFWRWGADGLIEREEKRSEGDV